MMKIHLRPWNNTMFAIPKCLKQYFCSTPWIEAEVYTSVALQLFHFKSIMYRVKIIKIVTTQLFPELTVDTH